LAAWRGARRATTGGEAVTTPRDGKIEKNGFTLRCCAAEETLAMIRNDRHPAIRIFAALHGMACDGSGMMTDACADCNEIGVEVDGKVLAGGDLEAWIEEREEVQE